LFVLPAGCLTLVPVAKCQFFHAFAKRLSHLRMVVEVGGRVHAVSAYL
jgi:hypothetical protein